MKSKAARATAALARTEVEATADRRADGAASNFPASSNSRHPAWRWFCDLTATQRQAALAIEEPALTALVVDLCAKTAAAPAGQIPLFEWEWIEARYETLRRSKKRLALPAAASASGDDDGDGDDDDGPPPDLRAAAALLASGAIAIADGGDAARSLSARACSSSRGCSASGCNSCPVAASSPSRPPAAPPRRGSARAARGGSPS